MKPSKRPPAAVPLHEIPRQLTETVRETWRIILLLTVLAALSFAAPIFLLPLVPGLTISAEITAFSLGLSANLLVAIVIYLFLNRGLRSLNQINVIHRLPIGRFIGTIPMAERVRVLETFTDLVNDLNFTSRFRPAVQQALRNGAIIEILLIHPDSDAARQRAIELEGKAVVSREIRRNLARFFALQSDLMAALDVRGQLTIKLYKALPSIAAYMSDRLAYVSLFPVGERSDISPNLEIDMFSSFGSFVRSKFDELWDPGSKFTVSLANHMLMQIESSIPGSPLFYFTYYRHDDDPEDKSRCYVAGQAALVDRVTGSKVAFFVEGAKYEGVPHLLGPGSEKQVARALLQDRYDWSEEVWKMKLGDDPVVVRLDNINQFPMEAEGALDGKAS